MINLFFFLFLKTLLFWFYPGSCSFPRFAEDRDTAEQTLRRGLASLLLVFFRMLFDRKSSRIFGFEICQAFAAVHLYSLNPHLDLPEEAPQAGDTGFCELQTLQRMII